MTSDIIRLSRTIVDETEHPEIPIFYMSLTTRCMVVARPDRSGL